MTSERTRARRASHGRWGNAWPPHRAPVPRVAPKLSRTGGRLVLKLQDLGRGQGARVDGDVVERAGKEPSGPHPFPHVEGGSPGKHRGRRGHRRVLWHTVDVEGEETRRVVTDDGGV